MIHNWKFITESKIWYMRLKQMKHEFSNELNYKDSCYQIQPQ